VPNRLSKTHFRWISQLITLALAAALIALPLNAASAGLFDFLFSGGSRPPPPSLPPQTQSYAPPAPLSLPREERYVSTGNGRWTVYCVRLCDGRYFPVGRHAGVTPAQACSSFCPASQTKVFSGGSITHATASNGARYADLANAFLYRKQIVAGCTCNGRDAFGLAPIETTSDPTLRTGDIVATRDGFVAYRSQRAAKNTDTNFTPIESYSPLSADLRRKLSETKVVPTPAASKLPIDAGATSAARTDDRRAQLFLR